MSSALNPGGYEAPRDAAELKRMELFGPEADSGEHHGDFFERDGHSLLAVRLKMGVDGIVPSARDLVQDGKDFRPQAPGTAFPEARGLEPGAPATSLVPARPG
jgi:hypothetical protein